MKRVIIDLERHKRFYDALKEQNPKLFSSNSKKKNRKKHEKIESTFFGDTYWNLKNSFPVELWVLDKTNVEIDVIESPLLLECIKGVISSGKWMENFKSKEDFIREVPSFVYYVLCLQPTICAYMGFDAPMARTFSVGRYLYLQGWMDGHPSYEEKVYSPPNDSVIGVLSNTVSRISMRMIIWVFVRMKLNSEDHVNIKRMSALVERTLIKKDWWETDISSEDVGIDTTKFIKDKTSVLEWSKEIVSDRSIPNKIEFFHNLPKLIEYYHSRPKNKKKYSKATIIECSTKTHDFNAALTILRNYGQWTDIVDAKFHAEKINIPFSAIMFEDPQVTIDQVNNTMETLFDEWGRHWAGNIQGVTGYYRAFRTPQGILMFAPTSWINQIQERLIPFLCFHPSFHRRYPVPIAPWLVEKYFFGDSIDKEIVIRAFYRLVLMYTRGNDRNLLATPQETELFSVYEQLHLILDHFPSEEYINTEFRIPFRDPERLLFRRKKDTDDPKADVLVGIKDMPCLQRALKSVLEIKAPHYITILGLSIIHRARISDMELPKEEGKLTQEQTINIYRLCASRRLSNDDALKLFYDIHVKGEIYFSAKLNGSDNWTRVSPFLREYNARVLKKIEERQKPETNDNNNNTPTPCLGLYYVFKISEEMAHYPFRVTRGTFLDETKAFRGRSITTTLQCDPRDFFVSECRCPFMLHAENASGSPKAWFNENMFPLYGPKLFYGQTTHITFPWKDLRPFEDTHPLFLEFLVA